MSVRKPDLRVRLKVATWPENAPRGAVAEFCRRHGVSRAWFYRVRAKALAEGSLAATEVGSSRPRTSPSQTPAEIAELAVMVDAFDGYYNTERVHQRHGSLGLPPAQAWARTPVAANPPASSLAAASAARAQKPKCPQRPESHTTQPPIICTRNDPAADYLYPKRPSRRLSVPETGHLWPSRPSSMRSVAIRRARSAACGSPSAAATIDPFSRIWTDQAKLSGSSRSAARARSAS